MARHKRAEAFRTIATNNRKKNILKSLCSSSETGCKTKTPDTTHESDEKIQICSMPPRQRLVPYIAQFDIGLQ